MCGRFKLSASAQRLQEVFPLYEFPEFSPRFNIAPTQDVLVVRQTEENKPCACSLRWGLIPSWAQDKKLGASLINARADTVATKPAFRAAFKRRRCLVIADGFYEWKKTDPKGRRQAFHIKLKDGSPFAFAGLWEAWAAAEQPIESCTIITTEANDCLRPLHDRMPVILDAGDYGRWLDPSACDPGVLQEMLRPFPASQMIAGPVSPYVNNSRNEGAGCLTEISEVAPAVSLIDNEGSSGP